MKILVLGVYYAANLGDGIICDCAAAMLRERYPKAEVVIRDISARTSFGENENIAICDMIKYNIKLHCWRWLTRYTTRDCFYARLAYDLERDRPHIDWILSEGYNLVVFAGGQMFMDWLSPYVAAYTDRFAKKGVRVLFNACGAGPAFSSAIRRRLAGALSHENVCWVSTRDDADFIKQKYMTNERTIEIIGDPGLWAAQVYNIEPCQNGPIGLGIMFPLGGSFLAAAIFWKRLIRRLESENRNWMMFCNGDAADQEFGLWLLRWLGFQKKKYCRGLPSPRS